MKIRVDMNPYSARLYDTMSKVVESWLRDLFAKVLSGQGIVVSAETDRMDRVVSETARRLLADVDELLSHEAWEQRRNPLDLARSATENVTTELKRLGAGPVSRDEFKERSFPDDVFDIAPATWSDLHPDLHEPGLEWGAWKAAAIMSHRRSIEGRSS